MTPELQSALLGLLTIGVVGLSYVARIVIRELADRLDATTRAVETGAEAQKQTQQAVQGAIDLLTRYEVLMGVLPGCAECYEQMRAQIFDKVKVLPKQDEAHGGE